VGFAPAEAMAYILLKDPDQLYVDVHRMTRKFCDAKKFDVEDDLLMEIVRYQKACVPVWPVPKNKNNDFDYNIPEYFDAITHGKEPPVICREPMVMNVVIPDNLPEGSVEFVRQRIRGSVVMKTYDVEYRFLEQCMESGS